MSDLITTGYHDKAVANRAVGHDTVATDGPAYGAKMILFSNHLTITKDTVVADLTPAVFSGYAASTAVTYGAPGREPDGSYSVTTGTKQFQVVTATPVVPDTIVGAALIDSATPPNLLAAGLFEEPVDMTIVGNSVNVVMKINHGGDGSLSQLVQVV